MPHTEKIFLKSKAYLESKLDIPFGSIPFFVLLNKTRGGALRLYDLPWHHDQYVRSNNQGEYEVIEAKSGKIFSLQSLDYLNVKLKTGDLFVFNGQTIWHSLERVRSKTNRVTLGGFIHKKIQTKLDSGIKI